MELEKRAVKIERFERDHAKELKELVSHRAQKRDEKWQRWKRDQKEEERRLKDEHEKLIKHYEEKKERLMAVVAKRDEGIKRNAEVVNKRIEDIQMKREMQEMHDQDGLEVLVKEIEDKSRVFIYYKSIVAKNEENTKQLLEERAIRARDYNDYHLQRVRDFKQHLTEHYDARAERLTHLFIKNT